MEPDDDVVDEQPWCLLKQIKHASRGEQGRKKRVNEMQSLRKMTCHDNKAVTGYNMKDVIFACMFR